MVSQAAGISVRTVNSSGNMSSAVYHKVNFMGPFVSLAGKVVRIVVR